MLLKHMEYDKLLLEFLSGVSQYWKETSKRLSIIYKLYRMNVQSLD